MVRFHCLVIFTILLVTSNNVANCGEPEYLSLPRCAPGECRQANVKCNCFSKEVGVYCGFILNNLDKTNNCAQNVKYVCPSASQNEDATEVKKDFVDVCLKEQAALVVEEGTPAGSGML